MAPRYPGFPWRPTGDDGALRDVVDACSFHEAVARAEDSVFGWAQQAHPCHMYVGKMGSGEQYIDLDRRAAGVSDGNSHVATIESYDGLQPHTDAQGNYSEIPTGGIYGDSANTGIWDAGQVERLADIAAWMHVALGVQLVVSQKAGAPGFNGHRIGIEPWRSQLYGSGERWTRHDGKPCPGDLRMAQIPGIISRAQQIAGAVRSGSASWLPPGRVDVAAALARGGGAISRPTQSQPIEQNGLTMDAEVTAAFAALNAKIDAVAKAIAISPADAKMLNQWSLGEMSAAALQTLQVLRNTTNEIKGAVGRK